MITKGTCMFDRKDLETAIQFARDNGAPTEDLAHHVIRLRDCQIQILVERNRWIVIGPYNYASIELAQQGWWGVFDNDGLLGSDFGPAESKRELREALFHALVSGAYWSDAFKGGDTSRTSLT